MDIKKILNENDHSDNGTKANSGKKEQPKKPMTKKDKIINIVGWIIIILVVVKGCSFIFSDDDKTTDTDTSAVEVQEETETAESVEPEKTPEEEAKEAKERRQVVEEISQSEPFEGMAAEYIDCTSCGAHDYDENALHGNEDEYDLLCYWHTRDTSELERSWFMRVYIKDGKVTDIQHRDYWTDGTLDLDKVLEDRKDNTNLLSGDTEVDNSWTGKEYADTKWESYLETVNSDGKYQALDNDSKEAIAWCKALDYWLEKKEAEHYDVEQYYETIRNSKK